MKIIFKTVILLIIMTGFSMAETSVRSDFNVLSEVFSSGIYKIIKSHHTFPGKKVFLSFPYGIELSLKARRTVEALFTRGGFPITGKKQHADYIISISVPDLRIIYLKKDKFFQRSIVMKIHMQCMDASGNIVFASGQEETYSDSIPGNSFRSIDDSVQFSEDIKRQVINKKHVWARLNSFILITVILAFFAFK